MPFCAMGCVLNSVLGWSSLVSLHYSISLSQSEGFRYHMLMIVKFVFQAHFSLPKPRHILLLNEYFNLLISQRLQYWNLNIPCFPLKAPDVLSSLRAFPVSVVVTHYDLNACIHLKFLS